MPTDDYRSNAELLRRIEARRLELGLSKRKLSLMATGKVDAIRGFERHHAPSVAKVRAIAKALKVPAEHLLEAIEGDVQPDIPPSFDAYIPPASLATPPGYVRIESLIPKHGMGGGGGTGAAIDDGEVYGEPALLPEQLIRGQLQGEPSDFLYGEVDGQSMEPILHSGDFIIINRRKRNPMMPGIFALREPDGLVVKWVQREAGSSPLRLKVTSEIPRFDPYFVLADEVDIIGRVVWFSRKL